MTTLEWSSVTRQSKSLMFGDCVCQVVSSCMTSSDSTSSSWVNVLFSIFRSIRCWATSWSFFGRNNAKQGIWTKFVLVVWLTLRAMIRPSVSKLTAWSPATTELSSKTGFCFSNLSLSCRSKLSVSFLSICIWTNPTNRSSKLLERWVRKRMDIWQSVVLKHPWFLAETFPTEIAKHTAFLISFLFNFDMHSNQRLQLRFLVIAKRVGAAGQWL